MSVCKLALSVFRFDAQKDYNPFYEKCVFEYQDNTLLSEVLQALPLRDLSYDTSIALKINNIAVFSNRTITELVGRFGKEWVLEPISIRYALKDLLINSQEALNFYRSFMKSGEFLTSKEKAELSKFININFISPQKNPDYFGDGFFLYVKWLFTRHPNQIKRLLESVSDPKNGVMNFVSVADFVYPKDESIDQEIFGMQKMLTQVSKCPFAGSGWVDFSKDIQNKFQFPTTAPTIEPIKAQNGTYALFSGYDKKWNFEPLLISAAAWLEKMGLMGVRLDFCYDGGYWGSFCDPEKFLLANAYNMALAHKNNTTLLLCDRDAYANVLQAKKTLDTDQSLRDKINQSLARYGLVYEENIQIAYLNALIADTLQWEVSQSFDGFSTIFFKGSSKLEEQEVCYGEIFKKIALKRYEMPLQNESYAHLFAVNPDSALKQSGAILYEGIDRGVDFIMSASMGQFEVFDTHAKKTAKLYKRDLIPTPTLFLPQVVLLALGEKDLKKIGLHLHKNKVNFI
ncbi:hypothetical protein BKH46_02330 [Helicobacter sp. 12S02634-8]|uniref:DUF5644 domain-containing protein n=1 Tax=Helicobacter sp. 12S02634-8 TaxID=1476199 RepID=UPI000BA62AC2|nr:DUF5644 domain-containing protein [Helicobacter sp. 12S02634-8]PAF48164.1 hypothetical protein BKH46_02330 [Helicobacter sp. 12S02634-8]